jgi:hypothetical protein
MNNMFHMGKSNVFDQDLSGWCVESVKSYNKFSRNIVGNNFAPPPFKTNNNCDK